MIIEPQELPVGVFTAVLGGPVFILLVRQAGMKQSRTSNR